MEFIITSSKYGTYVPNHYLEKLNKYSLSTEKFKEPYLNSFSYNNNRDFEINKIQLESIDELYNLINLFKCKVTIRELFFTPNHNHIFKPSLEIDEIIYER
jgi:hypothetical protein